MKFFRLFDATGYHTTFITSFCVDFDTYEAVILARLREAGSTNNVLVADERMLALATAEGASLPQHAGRRYSVLGVRSTGVFHPKIVLQLGRSKARLTIASANMTAAGVAGNLEVVGSVEASEEDSAFAPLLRQALDYLSPLVNASPAGARQWAWALNKSPWLQRVAASEMGIDSQGRRVAFLSDRMPGSIGGHFVDIVGGSRVTRLVVVSPYWDGDLAALRGLAQRLEAAEVCVVINPASQLFPAHAVRADDSWQFFDVRKLGGPADGRFAHAKVVIAQTADADHVLYGSANCTVAAMGAGATTGINAEACIYRQMPASSAVEALELSIALASDARIELTALPPFEPTEPIPMQDLTEHLPGSFVLSGRALAWSTSPGVPDSTQLEFYDRNGEVLSVSAAARGTSGGDRYFELAGTDEPHFARAVAPDFRSSLGIVQVDLALARSQRKSESKAIREQLDYLDGEDAGEGMWLLEVIQQLASFERPQAGNKQAKRMEEAPEGEVKTLSYQEFIAGRGKGNGMRTGASSLAASHMDSVRAFLNFLIGQTRGVSPDVDAVTPEVNLQMGDETDNPENAIETGQELNKRVNAGTVDEAARLKRMQRHWQQYTKDTQTSIDKAIDDLLKKSRERGETECLNAVDVLRFRALVMVVLSAGTRKSQLFTSEMGEPAPRRQVLASRVEPTWRSLSGRLLFGYFRRHTGENRPLVEFVRLEQQEGATLPTDILEAWVTCMWAACARLCASDQDSKLIVPTAKDVVLAQSVYGSLALEHELLDSDVVTLLFDGLTERYGSRLGVNVNALRELHRRRGHLPE